MIANDYPLLFFLDTTVTADMHVMFRDLLSRVQYTPGFGEFLLAHWRLAFAVKLVYR